MTGKWRALNASLLIAAGLAALGASAPDRHLAASDVVPAMAISQQSSDPLPSPAAHTVASQGIDLRSTRFLGSGKYFEYFAASKGSDLICVVVVRSDGNAQQTGCGSLGNFGTYGLRLGARVGDSDWTEEAWLVVPNTTPAALNDQGLSNWTRKSNNFLVKEAVGE